MTYTTQILLKNININFKIKIIIYFSLISWSITGPFLGQGNTLLGLSSHMIPSAISLIFFESILRNLKSKFNGFLIILFHFLCVFIYLNNHWVGMGRIF